MLIRRDGDFAPFSRKREIMTYARNPSLQAPATSFFQELESIACVDTVIDIYDNPFADIERDLTDYIMGLWHMRAIHKMVANKGVK